MTKIEKPRRSPAARHAQGRRRAGGLDRHAGRRSTPCSRSARRTRRRSQAAAHARPALLLHRGQCRRHASRPSSARWTWATACTSRSARSWPRNSTCRSSAVKVFMGDTATSVNQGGASGSTGIQLGGKQMRVAAAEARRVLVEMAAEKLGAPGRPAHRRRRRRQRTADRGKETSYARADRRALFQRAARLEQAIRQRALRARQGAAEEAERVQDRRPADQARGRGAEGVLPRRTSAPTSRCPAWCMAA